MTEKEVMDYFDLIMHYYQLVAKRGLKGKYNEKKSVKLLDKLDEWENRFTEYLELGA